nr:glycosyltransferase [uncultured Methanobrevibacter sp.]
MENVAEYLISVVDKNENQPLISVVMPVYNRKDVVMNAIDSVLSQTYENFELIVVDDASTDGTTELLKEIDHDKVRVIYHEKNKYASGARNTGLKESKGELIAYLDSDNLWDERYLEATVGAFLCLPDAGGIYSAQYRFETYDSNPFAVQFSALNKSLLHNHNFVDMNCFAHRKSVCNKIDGFDETIKGADDWDLILKISNEYKIYSVPFLLSNCYVGVVENRVSDLIPTDMKKIREQNEKLPKTDYVLDKKISIVIPVFENASNIKTCIETIFSLYPDFVEVIVSNNNPFIDLKGELSEFDNVKIVESDTNLGFTDSLIMGIESSDSSSDILILSQDAILTEGSLEFLQECAYSKSDAGLVVSQQVLKNGSLIKKHVPYAHIDYWCDITPSSFYNNIENVPLFHDGEFLELKLAQFFCTYLKRDVLNRTSGFDSRLGKHYHSMRLFSEYVRNILGLKIYHVSNSVVISNISEDARNSEPLNIYDFNFSKNQWDRKLSEDLGYKTPLWDM